MRHSLSIVRNLTFEAMFRAASDNPTKIAKVSNTSFVA